MLLDDATIRCMTPRHDEGTVEVKLSFSTDTRSTNSASLVSEVEGKLGDDANVTHRFYFTFHGAPVVTALQVHCGRGIAGW